MEDKLILELKKIIKGNVSVDEKILEENSRDASIFEIKPRVVVFPKNEKDIERLVKFVTKYKRNFEKNSKLNKNIDLSITARSGGTDMTGGPLTESIVVSFTKYFDTIKKLDSKHAVVQPGVYYRDLEKKMNKLGVFYPSYPASKSICALGGMIANNSGSEKTLTYGQTVDHVRKLRVVLSDGKTYEFKKLSERQLKSKMKQKDFEGNLYREIFKLCDENYDLINKHRPKTHKNSCGYFLWRVWDRDKKEFDLTKLFVGSQGTLGMWVEADVNVVKKKKYSRLVTVFLNDLKQLAQLVNIVLPYKPETLESFDNNTLKLGLRFMPEIAKKVGKNFFSFLWDFRHEGIMTLKRGLPVFVVLVELTGDDKQELQNRTHILSHDLTVKGIMNRALDSEEEGEKYWIMRRESFNLLRNKVKDKLATPFVDDFAVNADQLPKFLPKLYGLLKTYGIKPTLAGHIGDGNFHIIPLMNLDNEEERRKIPIVLNKFVDLVIEHGGTITAEHNDGLIRTPFVEKQYGTEMNKLFERVKDIFDPENIFNPGKKVRGNLDYAMSHIKSDRDKHYHHENDNKKL